jgi:2-polyprenyl-3-methyl-5-hydroxy-6-metoxy-1,4-benzoquinol methylase
MSNCTICKTEAAGVYIRRDGYTYIRCPGCGFVFLDPMPDAEFLSRVYNEDESAIDVAFYPKAASRMRRAMLKALGLWPYYVGRDALDVGCGGGFMVAAMRRLGARAVGIDISRESIEYARARFPRGDFVNETFEAFLSQGRKFAFLYSSEVIEHIGDVQGYMRFLAGVAAPGARLYLTTPDMDHPNVPDDPAQWNMVSPPRHVQLFNERNLYRLFAEYGFEVIKRYPKDAPTLQVLARKT